jgi:hypothetical protein
MSLDYFRKVVGLFPESRGERSNHIKIAITLISWPFAAILRSYLRENPILGKKE